MYLVISLILPTERKKRVGCGLTLEGDLFVGWLGNGVKTKEGIHKC
jgi:hypothetical protein